MGLLDTIRDGPIRQFFGDERDLDQVTLQDLKDKFGEDAVERGLSYMASLSEADENHRNADGENYVKGMERSGVNIEDDDREELAKKWESEQNDRGIGLED